jgi:hypothetical protein
MTSPGSADLSSYGVELCLLGIGIFSLKGESLVLKLVIPSIRFDSFFLFTSLSLLVPVRSAPGLVVTSFLGTDF